MPAWCPTSGFVTIAQFMGSASVSEKLPLNVAPHVVAASGRSASSSGASGGAAVLSPQAESTTTKHASERITASQCER